MPVRTVTDTWWAQKARPPYRALLKLPTELRCDVSRCYTSRANPRRVWQAIAHRSRPRTMRFLSFTASFPPYARWVGRAMRAFTDRDIPIHCKVARGRALRSLVPAGRERCLRDAAARSGHAFQPWGRRGRYSGRGTGRDPNGRGGPRGRPGSRSAGQYSGRGSRAASASQRMVRPGSAPIGVSPVSSWMSGLPYSVPISR